MTKRSETRELLGDSPQSFGRRLASLRVRAALSQHELAQAIGVSRPEVANWEGGLATPRPRNVEELSRLFLTQGSLNDYNQVFEFCLSARCVPVLRVLTDGTIEIEKTGVADDRFTSVGSRMSASYARSRGGLRRTIGLSLDEGLKSINEHLRAVRSPTSRKLLSAERRLARLLKSQPRDIEGLKLLRDELVNEAASDRRPEDRFAGVRLLGQLLMGIHDYDGALAAFQQAYYVARSLHYTGAPWALEALAQLCELVAKAHLSVGTRVNWDAAEHLLREALGLRQQLREEFARVTEEGLVTTLRSMLELARAETNRRDLERAERSYLDLLDNPRLRERPFLHASAEKELADNYRIAEQSEKAHQHFQRALNLYSAVMRDELARNDPDLTMEAELNIGYCLRRLGREPEAVKRFSATLTLAQRLRDRRRIAHACTNLARSPDIQRDRITACAYLFAAMRIFEQMGAEADLEHHQAMWRELSEDLPMGEVQSMPERCRQMGLL